jgi:DNA-binding NtrC family response regulator
MSYITWNILVACSDQELRRSISTILVSLGFDPIRASRVSQCRELIHSKSIDLIFCDQYFEDGDYRDIATACRSAQGSCRLVVTVPAHGTGDEQALRQEVFGMVRVPLCPTEIEWMVIRAKRSQLQLASEEREGSLGRAVSTTPEKRFATLIEEPHG